jgi:hypothetical protein
MEEEKKDAYKKAFDKFMIETIDEINFSIDSLKLISKHTLKNSKLLFDLASGNKCIKKDKEGNIIVSDKSKLTEEYKEKIEHLYTKLKKYQNEVKKYKEQVQTVHDYMVNRSRSQFNSIAKQTSPEIAESLGLDVNSIKPYNPSLAVPVISRQNPGGFSREQLLMDAKRRGLIPK